MSRREKINEALKSVSKKAGTPGDDESLFDSGYLDSFTLADLVTALEDSCGVKVPDADVNPRKFDNVEKIDSYLESLGA